MVTAVSKQTYAIRRKYQFLQNFPFSEFRVESGDQVVPTFFNDEDASSKIAEPSLIKFIYDLGVSNMTVVIFERELSWINQVAEKITDLDGALSTINLALTSDDLLTKRDAVNFTEKWCSQLEDGKIRLSYSTAGEIIASLVESQAQLILVINKLVKLAIGKGLVNLTKKEYQIILTYYQFQLIYSKLILGIVISSKISL
jgi:hypothetical protein